MTENTRKLKRVVIKEELVELTGDYRKAIILQQFIYWTDIKAVSDKMIAEEIAISKRNGEATTYEPMFGWIYKTAEELSDEIMLGLAKSNIRKYIKELVVAGFIRERRNPRHRWDRTLQYRANLTYIQECLNELGYSLEGFSLTAPRSSKIELRSVENEHLASSKIELHSSKIELRNAQNETAIPEITTKTTSKITKNNNVHSTNEQESVGKIEIEEKVILSSPEDNLSANKKEGHPTLKSDTSHFERKYNSTKLPEKKKKPTSGKVDKTEKQFNLLWTLYPKGRKQGKAIAKKAFVKAIKDGVPFELIQEKLQEYNKQIEIKKTETKYIKMASTWFNQKGWEDDYDTEQEKSTNQPNYDWGTEGVDYL